MGEYLPDRVVTNAELEARCELTPGWIRKRTGVETRHWVADGETNSSMAAQAALAQASIQASDLDLVINASGTTEQIIPDSGPSSCVHSACRTVRVPSRCTPPA